MPSNPYADTDIGPALPGIPGRAARSLRAASVRRSLISRIILTIFFGAFLLQLASDWHAGVSSFDLLVFDFLGVGPLYYALACVAVLSLPVALTWCWDQSAWGPACAKLALVCYFAMSLICTYGVSKDWRAAKRCYLDWADATGKDVSRLELDMIQHSAAPMLIAIAECIQFAILFWLVMRVEKRDELRLLGYAGMSASWAKRCGWAAVGIAVCVFGPATLWERIVSPGEHVLLRLALVYVAGALLGKFAYRLLRGPGDEPSSVWCAWPALGGVSSLALCVFYSGPADVLSTISDPARSVAMTMRLVSAFLIGAALGGAVQWAARKPKLAMAAGACLLAVFGVTYAKSNLANSGLGKPSDLDHPVSASKTTGDEGKFVHSIE